MLLRKLPNYWKLYKEKLTHTTNTDEEIPFITLSRPEWKHVHYPNVRLEYLNSIRSLYGAGRRKQIYTLERASFEHIYMYISVTVSGLKWNMLSQMCTRSTRC
jgi:hypothetical protein